MARLKPQVTLIVVASNLLTTSYGHPGRKQHISALSYQCHYYNSDRLKFLASYVTHVNFISSELILLKLLVSVQNLQHNFFL